MECIEIFSPLYGPAHHHRTRKLLQTGHASPRHVAHTLGDLVTPLLSAIPNRE